MGPNSPHEFLPDPCDPSYFGDPDYVYKLIQMHTTFLSETTAETATQVTRGDIVSVELEPTEASYNLQHGKYLRLLSQEAPPAAESQACAALVKLFGQVSETPLKLREFGGTAGFAPGTAGASPEGTARPPTTADLAHLPADKASYGLVSHLDFFKKMRALLPINKFSDEFIYGMMGNVNLESGFREDIAGDPGCLARHGGSNRQLYGSGNSGKRLYAAFGLFQMNICSPTAKGTQYLEAHGLSRVDRSKMTDADFLARYNVLTDGDKQIAFVAQYLNGTSHVFTETGMPAVIKYTEWFMTEVENPSEKAKKDSRAIRYKYAKGFASTIPVEMAARATESSPTCKAPGAGGVADTDFRWLEELDDGTWNWECIV
jgi:hypothetical protein